MNKKLLSEYIDACELVKETEQEMKKLKRKRTLTVQDHVKGSNPDFPYQEQQFHISGTVFSYKDDMLLHTQEHILEERKAQAEHIKFQVEMWLNTIPIRMQRIITYKIFEGLSWEQAAAKMGRKATGNSIRMELERFLKEK